MLQFGTTFPEAPPQLPHGLAPSSYGPPFMLTGGDPAPCGSAPWPLLCSRSRRRPRLQLRAPETAHQTSNSDATINISARGHIRRCSSLYALDSRLQAWHARLGSLETEEAIFGAAGVPRAELPAARATLKTSRRSLVLELRALYEQGDVDPLAVVLGATSLEHGPQPARRPVAGRRPEPADRRRDSRAATAASSGRRQRSRRSSSGSTARWPPPGRPSRGSRAAAATRAAYVASLRAQERLRAEQVRSVESQAQAAQQKSETLQQPTLRPPTGKRQLTVSATCYDLSGRTATGLPVGPGIVAVDPSVIPLGTRMYIPGYGNGVAADVGGGIKGNIIDLWYAAFAECATWGRRTVTITIY